MSLKVSDGSMGAELVGAVTVVVEAESKSCVTEIGAGELVTTYGSMSVRSDPKIATMQRLKAVVEYVFALLKVSTKVEPTAPLQETEPNLNSESMPVKSAVAQLFSLPSESFNFAAICSMLS